MKDQVRALERLLDVTRELTATVDLGPLLTKIVAVAAELTESEGASILLLDKQTGELRFRAAHGSSASSLADIPVPVEGSIAGTVLNSGNPVVVSDPRKDPRHYEQVGEQIDMDIRSLAAVPMHFKDQNIGVLEAVNKQEGVFTEQDIDMLLTLGSQAAVAVENARLVEELRQAYARLGELDRLKSDFIAIASHELRTPLGLILGYATLLRDQVGEAASHQMDVVVRAALRVKHIIETMLNLRYLETGELTLVCVPFDLCAEIRSACNAYRTLVESQGLTLSLHLPPHPLQICADRDKVRTILDNLLSNAVKFTPQGGHIWVLASGQQHTVKVTIADDGIGIPPEALGRIFERFEQVEHHMTRRHGGMGLGLSIVRGLVELHGGRIWAESEPEKGSHFTFILPIKPPIPAEETSKEE